MNIDLYWRRYKLFSYEKKLAALEVSILSGNSTSEFTHGLKAAGDFYSLDSLCKCTYFRQIIMDGNVRRIPLQARLELAGNGHSNGKRLPPNRQVTRYSAHGLHEYRGKFNPQIVRAIGNILGIKEGDWILDPFCGSGTTLLEALHNRWNAIGLDCNPLAIQIANAKIAAIDSDENSLAKSIASLACALHQRISNLTFETPLSELEKEKLAGIHWRDRLPNFNYLEKWFISDVLVQFSAILQEVDSRLDAQSQLVATVILSDIVREASLQDPSDLRIRRRKAFPETYDVITPYLRSLKTKLATVSKAKQVLTDDDSTQVALLGDIRNASSLLNTHPCMIWTEEFDGVITSPPYAAGLPYVDTDRLSLVLLGLINADDIHDTQRSLIGNREISKSERDGLLAAIGDNAANLPAKVIEFCRELKDAVGSGDGFRKMNSPAVIYKYFAEMAESFSQVRRLVKVTAPYALVVGVNRTTLGGRRFLINTPQLLIEIAAQYGFELDRLIRLDTYQRYNIHRANSINSEYLIILRAV